MNRIALHFPSIAKAALYLAFLTSWLSGTVWFSLHQWVRIEGEFGEEHSTWEPMLIEIHGGSAMVMMVFYGYLLASHIPTGLRSKRNRFLGLTLTYGIAFMIFTAYGLYYIGGESFRSLVSWAHLSVGFCLPLVLALHIWCGHYYSHQPKKAL
ncbi:MAG: hypothetical protein RL693_2694 [Verrucomicrobiota bacterium]|jgi:hypothetical protein